MRIKNKTPKGEFIGSGVSSAVYEHPTDDDKVIMFGWLDDDLLKLNLYNEIKALHNVIIDGNTYAATLDRMFSDDDVISSTVSKAESLYHSPDEGIAELATNPDLSDKAALLMFFVIEHDIVFSFDNHDGNWLLDNEENCLPMDLFHCPRYSNEVESELTNNIASLLSYFQES